MLPKTNHSISTPISGELIILNFIPTGVTLGKDLPGGVKCFCTSSNDEYGAPAVADVAD